MQPVRFGNRAAAMCPKRTSAQAYQASEKLRRRKTACLRRLKGNFGEPAAGLPKALVGHVATVATLDAAGAFLKYQVQPLCEAEDDAQGQLFPANLPQRDVGAVKTAFRRWILLGAAQLGSAGFDLCSESVH